MRSQRRSRPLLHTLLPCLGPRYLLHLTGQRVSANTLAGPSGSPLLAFTHVTCLAHHSGKTGLVGIEVTHVVVDVKPPLSHLLRHRISPECVICELSIRGQSQHLLDGSHKV